jgi:hypothetical protein
MLSKAMSKGITKKQKKHHLESECPSITAIRKENSQELFLCFDNHTIKFQKKYYKVSKLLPVVNNNEKTARLTMSNLKKQANLPELLRSIPPRVRFTSLPF